MPHCIIEYSNDLEQTDKILLVLEMVNESMVSSGLFNVDSIKVRAIPVSKYLIGGKTVPFIHATVRLLAGRTDEQKHILSQAILDTISKQFHSIDNITVDVIDINPNCYSKKPRSR